jgi:hypothetical protein
MESMMAKTVEYRAIPRDVWTVVRFEREDVGEMQVGGSSHCGEFPNEELAAKYGEMIASAEAGSRFVSRGSLNKARAG